MDQLIFHHILIYIRMVFHVHLLIGIITKKNIEFDEKHYNSLIQSGLLNEPNKEKWEIINNERNYIPCQKDIGHQIMLETMILDKNSISSGNLIDSNINPFDQQQNELNESSEYESSSEDDDASQNNQNKMSSVKYSDVQQNEINLMNNQILLRSYNESLSFYQ